MEALQRPPCVVSFSGGRDSSAMLCVAADVARREGLPLPVPATLVFPGSEDADEEGWQRLVLKHLDLEHEWTRLEFSDELDAVGPVAQRVLERHGLAWPFNLHFHLPIVEVADGGSLVTGFAGDELALLCSTVRAERLVVKRSIEQPLDLARIVYRLAPRAPRWPVEFLRAGGQIDEMNVTWLTRRGRVVLRNAFALDSLLHAGWERILRDYLWRSRYVQVCKANFQRMADVHSVTMYHPFVEPPVVMAMAKAGGFGGLSGREEILRLLTGDRLPQEILTRQGKATFRDPLWTATAKAFAESWTGTGLDERLVDPQAVHDAWLNDPPVVLTTTMLQAAWLAANGVAR